MLKNIPAPISSVETTVSEGTRGIVVSTAVCAGERCVVTHSSFIPFLEDAMSKLDIAQEAVVEKALQMAAAILQDGGNPAIETATKPATGDPIVEDAAPDVPKKPDAEPCPAEKIDEGTSAEESVVTEVAADVEETKEKPVSEPAEEEPTGIANEVASEPVELTVEEAGNVCLVLLDNKRGQNAANSSLKEYVGKPLRELYEKRPSYIRMLASQAGTDKSVVTPEAEAAVLVLNKAI